MEKNNMIQCDCFAYCPESEDANKISVVGHCKVLTELLCRKKKCPFYKTQEEYDRIREIYG